LVSAAKNYRFVDVFHNTSLLDNRKTTVELIMNESDKSITKYTQPVTKKVIINCMDAFRPIIDEYAAQFKHVAFGFFEEQPITFYLVLTEILNDSLLKVCIPFTRVAKLFKYMDWIQDFIQDILKYMISSRPEELYSGRNQKVRASVSLLEKIIMNEDVYKVWNEFR
jgi:predicted AlkP superfamily pyrophosphatase or phosphodiesterase